MTGETFPDSFFAIFGMKRATMKRNKYGAKKTIVDGITFDSKAEAARYCQLMKMQKDGEIRALIIKPKYLLAAGIKFTPDFAYLLTRDNKRVVEDVKGMVTRDFKLRAKLFKDMHKEEVQIIKMSSRDVNNWLAIGIPGN